ncbi:MAG: sulfite exporter TauE/SafE family protein [Sporichthyaceae bacterium]
MTGLEMLAVLLAGIAAGALNAIVGSGTLITFPVLLAIGYPPVLANVSNTVGLTPGSVSGAVGYRTELAGQRARLVSLGFASVLGGLTGAVLLLTLPPGAFRAIVPVLIGISLVLVVLQPRLSRRLGAKSDAAARSDRPGAALHAGVYGAGIYGGYFGAAQGVLLIGLLGAFLHEDLQRINAAKNVLAGLVNGMAALVFVAVADVAWEAAGLIAVGSVIGGQLGASIGRRVPSPALRGLIVVVGVLAIVKILVG